MPHAEERCGLKDDVISSPQFLNFVGPLARTLWALLNFQLREIAYCSVQPLQGESGRRPDMTPVSEAEKRALKACLDRESILDAHRYTLHCPGVSPQVLWTLWRDGLIAEQHVAKDRWIMVLTPRGRYALDGLT